MFPPRLRPLIRVAGLTVGLMFIAPAAYAAAETYDEVEERNLAVVRAGLDAWRDGTGSPFDALAADATWEITGNSVAAGLYTSKEEFLDEVIEPFNARMSSGLVPTVRDLYADNDTVVAFFDAEATARDGLPYRNTYAWFLRLDDGWIVEARAFFDSIAFDELWNRVPV